MGRSMTGNARRVPDSRQDQPNGGGGLYDGENGVRVKVIVNGTSRQLPEGATIGQLLDELGASPQGIAVACNEHVIRRADYATHQLEEEDRLEIIRAVAGG
ncbi:MAG: sulfur carrier protein ThiS [Vulcanimicrobiaceae bacterium]